MQYVFGVVFFFWGGGRKIPQTFHPAPEAYVRDASKNLLDLVYIMGFSNDFK